MNTSLKKAVAACTAAVTVFVLAPQAQADEVDDLLASMEEVSRQANAKNEEVKQLADDIAVAEQDLVGLEAGVAQANDKAREAREAESVFREDVDRIAGVKYRGALVDPITNAMGAENPQNAIDRAAYLGTLTEKNRAAIERLQDATKKAVDEQGRASRAVAAARFKKAMLVSKQTKLEAEQADLDARTEEIQARVDALDPIQRQRWIEKNGPVSGFEAVASGSASAAVNAALSKVGAPYGWGAAGPDVFDCSGLVYWAYQQQGITIPRTSQAQMAGGTPVSMDALQPGDVIGYFGGASHVGIYVGNGMIAHASDYGIPLQVVPVNSMPVYGARRYA